MIDIQSIYFLAILFSKTMKMLCTRHLCYHLFHDNKPSSKIFSNWQNSLNIFGSQFMQIQNINSNCNIHIQPQQLQYERCQFYTRKYTNDHLSSPDNHLDLESQFLWLDPNKRRNVRLRISKGKSGNKYFHIISYKYGQYKDFNNIMVPEDAYSFVRALDELIMELAAENFEENLLNQDSQSAIEIANDGHQTLKTVEFTGLFHKFQLELWFFPKTDKMNAQMQSSSLSLGLIAFHKITMKKIIRNLNLKALPWLRKQMAEMLAKYDGTEQIEKEAPAQIPQQLFSLGNINVLLPNCISSSAAHSFEDKRMRQPQEFVNKKPISFQQYPKMSAKMQNSNQSGHKKQMAFGMQGKPNLQQIEVKKPNKNGIEPPVDPQMAELEERIRTLFQIDDEEMDKYRRIAAKTKNPSIH